MPPEAGTGTPDRAWRRLRSSPWSPPASRRLVGDSSNSSRLSAQQAGSGGRGPLEQVRGSSRSSPARHGRVAATGIALGGVARRPAWPIACGGGRPGYTSASPQGRVSLVSWPEGRTRSCGIVAGLRISRDREDLFLCRGTVCPWPSRKSEAPRLEHRKEEEQALSLPTAAREDTLRSWRRGWAASPNSDDATAPLPSPRPAAGSSLALSWRPCSGGVGRGLSRGPGALNEWAEALGSPAPGHPSQRTD